MANCPNCGEYISVDRARTDRVVCPNCKVTLKAFISRKVGYAVLTILILMIFLAVVALMLTNQMYALLIPVVIAGASIRVAAYIVSLEIIRPESCSRCGRVVVLEGSSFCPNCGTDLSVRVEHRNFLTEEQVVSVGLEETLERKGSKTCTVCNLVLKPGDKIAWCPHCGNPAHRVHLLEWLHVKKYCPMCKEHLDEKELTQQLSVKPVQLKVGKASKKRTTR